MARKNHPVRYNVTRLRTGPMTSKIELKNRNNLGNQVYIEYRRNGNTIQRKIYHMNGRVNTQTFSPSNFQRLANIGYMVTDPRFYNSIARLIQSH